MFSPGGDQAPLDAELVHQAGEAEAVHQHADRADDAGLVGIDLVGGHGDVVGARGTDLLDDRIDLLLVQRLQAPDLVVDDAGLHRAAAGRIDAQHHRLRARVLEGGVQCADQQFGAGFAIGCDFAAHLDQRGVAARWCGGGDVRRTATRPTITSSSSQLRRKNDPPAAFAAPVLQVIAGKLLDRGIESGAALPVDFGAAEVRCRLDGRRSGGRECVGRTHGGLSVAAAGTGRISSEGYQQTWPACSSTCSAVSRERPQGPPTQRPSSGR